MNLNAKIGPQPIMDILKSLTGSDYLNGAHKNPEIMIEYFGTFSQISQNL